MKEWISFIVTFELMHLDLNLFLSPDPFPCPHHHLSLLEILSPTTLSITALHHQSRRTLLYLSLPLSLSLSLPVSLVLSPSLSRFKGLLLAMEQVHLRCQGSSSLSHSFSFSVSLMRFLHSLFLPF